MSIPKEHIPEFGVPISRCTLDDLLAFVVDARERRVRTLVDNVNMDILWNARHDEVYRDALRTLADVVLVDGTPVRWLARLAGRDIPAVVPLTDAVPSLLSLATKLDYGVFVLGSNPRTLARVKDNLRKKNSLPRIVGEWSERRETLEDEATGRAVVRDIGDASPDLLFVALGSPWQTKWIARNWQRLPASVVIPVGGAFDFIAETVPRAPAWMQRAGLEWFYRLTNDRQARDRSLFERYVIDDIPFALKLAYGILASKVVSP